MGGIIKKQEATPRYVSSSILLHRFQETQVLELRGEGPPWPPLPHNIDGPALPGAAPPRQGFCGGRTDRTLRKSSDGRPGTAQAPPAWTGITSSLLPRLRLVQEKSIRDHCPLDVKDAIRLADRPAVPQVPPAGRHQTTGGNNIQISAVKKNEMWSSHCSTVG